MVTKDLVKRAVVVAGAATLMVGASTTAAQAAGEITYSTTGAWGEAIYQSGAIGAMVYNLYAKDPLEDGHCAQWQIKIGSGSWSQLGSNVCSGSVTYVAKGYGKYNYFYRLCRTGVGNCTSTIELP